MSETVMFGKLSSEKQAEENTFCRHIVSEINNVGITERQRAFLIYLLALELENIELMKAVTATVREDSSVSFLVEQEKEG